MNNRFTHRRVTKAEYRVRKQRGKEMWSVTEWYDGERCQLVDDTCTSELKAITVAKSLADRDTF